LHAAQGRTVGTAHVLVDGLGDRQGLYVAMSRGRDANHAYCITDHSRAADTREGSRPAPELDRAERLGRERAGLPPEEPARDDQQLPVLDPVTVLTGVLARDGSELSATETLQHELSRADHLGVLGGIWDDVTRRVQVTRFEHALRGALPARWSTVSTRSPVSAKCRASSSRRSVNSRRCAASRWSRRASRSAYSVSCSMSPVTMSAGS